MLTKTPQYKKISQFRQLFYKLKNNIYFGRLGKTFYTRKNFYFFDTGTGKVARVKKNVYLVLKCLLENNDFDSLFELNISNDNIIMSLNEIVQAIKEQHILSAPILETLTGNSVLRLEDLLDSQLCNITLELTEECNLRCRYCIYNHSYPNYREFGHRNMTFEIAKKAIDFLNKHSSTSKEIYIGFYGGEPLLNFKLLKQCIYYAKTNIQNKKIIYAMTTNATLMTDNIANFLVENEVNITVSLDGPKIIHDENRIYTNGRGSFDDTVLGLKKLITAYKNKYVQPCFAINIVTSGPNYEEKYNKINKFLQNSDWLPDNLPVLCTTVDSGPEDSEYILPQSEKERNYIKDIYEPLFEWNDKNKKDTYNNQLFSETEINKSLLKIHKRLLTDKPVKQYGMNGCCVPGHRRLYITVDGEFYPCERVGDSPSLGNVDTGFNIPKIKKFYVHDFVNEAKKYCKNCWAVNLCSICYSDCYDKNGLHYKYRHKNCMLERKSIESALVRYHYILENNPEKLQELNEIDII